MTSGGTGAGAERDRGTGESVDDESGAVGSGAGESDAVDGAPADRGAADSRTAVLARIRAALSDVPDDETPEDVPVPRACRRTVAAGDPVALFAARVADYRATVVRCAQEDVARTVAALLERRGVRRVVVPDGFPPAFLTRTDVDLVGDTPPLTVRQLEAVESTLTTAAVAIAETGTIVLDTGPGQGRRVLSLIPDHLLCVVRAEQIVPDVPEALAGLDPHRPLTFVSGPSATSDIELQRVEGVHGPRILDVVLVVTDTSGANP